MKKREHEKTQNHSEANIGNIGAQTYDSVICSRECNEFI